MCVSMYVECVHFCFDGRLKGRSSFSFPPWLRFLIFLCFFLAADGSYFPYKKLRKNEASKRRIVVVRVTRFVSFVLFFFCRLPGIVRGMYGGERGKGERRKSGMDSFNNVGVVCGEEREGVLLTQLLQEKGGKKGEGEIYRDRKKKKRGVVG